MSWSVKINREELLAKIKENEAKHKAIVAEALVGYRAAVIEALDKRIEQIKANKPIDLVFRLPQPQDHSQEYATIIGMLEWSNEDTVSIGDDEFSWYVEDNWSWKANFVASTAGYTNSR